MKIRNKWNHWLPKLLKVNAIVLYPFILYKDPWSDKLKGIIKHEWVHIDQIRRVGVCRYYLSYLLYYVAGRLSKLGHYHAYRSIPWEVVAYRVGP